MNRRFVLRFDATPDVPSPFAKGIPFCFPLVDNRCFSQIVYPLVGLGEGHEVLANSLATAAGNLGTVMHQDAAKDNGGGRNDGPPGRANGVEAVHEEERRVGED